MMVITMILTMVIARIAEKRRQAAPKTTRAKRPKPEKVRTLVSSSGVTINAIATISSIWAHQTEWLNILEQCDRQRALWSRTSPTNNAECNASLVMPNSDLLTNLVLHRWDIQFDRRVLRSSNDDNQHPELYQPTGYDDVDEEEDIRRMQQERYREGGYTFATNLELDFGGQGFEDETTYGSCLACQEPLPVWRNCKDCLNEFVLRRRKGALTRAQECNNKDHMRDLELIGFCEWHGGQLHSQYRCLTHIETTSCSLSSPFSLTHACLLLRPINTRVQTPVSWL